ncbi:uncharacterized protein LOC123670894 [Harmonia axyridis]|uniref:uncharacterized protein LOC123670894 n=1 Tax=Harmonia axyridis TaxID=115357 RepID=UPI001E27925C|nr:uncharacterized protein LOC123670894 [Harmonia axyridis]
MPRCCSVLGCRSNYKSTKENVSVFRFPKDPVRRLDWIDAIHKDNKFKITTNTVVCIKHFLDKDILKEDVLPTLDGSFIRVPRKIPKLKDDAIPSIFPNQPSKKSPSVFPERTDPEESNQNDLDIQDQIESFSHFCSHFKDKEISNFLFNVKENNSVVFYKINFEGVIPKITSGFKILNDLKVEVFRDNINVPISEFNSLLGDRYICDRWSKFENLIVQLNRIDLDSDSSADTCKSSDPLVVNEVKEEIKKIDNTIKSCMQKLEDIHGDDIMGMIIYK